MAYDLKPCPSDAAYRRHLRHGEEPCRGCRQANQRRCQDRDGSVLRARVRARYALARLAGFPPREADRLSRRRAASVVRAVGTRLVVNCHVADSEGEAVDAFITALENRIKAAEAEVEKLIQEGEQEAAKLKAAVVAELQALLAEIQKVLSGQ